MLCRSTKRLLLVCAGLAVVLPMAGAAALVWLMLRVLEHAVDKAVADALGPVIVLLDFSENLAVGNKDAAYSLTSEDFQQRISREAFSTFVDEHPDLTSDWSENKVVNQTTDSVVYEVSSRPEEERHYKFRVRLQKEKEAWRIADIIDMRD
jgi:hypothetical protein